jgi:hypothetical protein
MAAQHDRDPRARQVRQPRLPCRCRFRQPLRAHAMHRRFGVEDVGPLGQGVLRRGDDQIEGVGGRPGSADMDESHFRRPGDLRLPLDPARHRLVAPAGRDHELRPGWLQRARPGAVDPEQRDLDEQVAQQLRRPIDHPLDLERPAQGLGQGQHLAVVARLVAEQQPDAGRALRPVVVPPDLASRSIHQSSLARPEKPRRHRRPAETVQSIAPGSGWRAP